AEEEYTEHPPVKEYMDGYNLQKRLRAYQDSHLYFLSHPEVDPTNNISERELRKFKRKQKQAVVLRSNTGGQHICDALTIIETARTQNKNVYDTVENAFAK
ncbi:Transposase IS66 family protein, partial [Oribacterium sp. KHPX15]|uniref:IS66 family transposase n=1 Tax=Oribacterium sp. KHPX15 TaxID=1855342 RepID=UPI00089579C8